MSEGYSKGFDNPKRRDRSGWVHSSFSFFSGRDSRDSVAITTVAAKTSSSNSRRSPQAGSGLSESAVSLLWAA